MTAQLVRCTPFQLGDNRTSRRRVVNLSAYAREVGAALLEVEVSDLSADGCRLRCDAELEPLSAVWLKIPGAAPRRAVIRWCADGEAGCEFDTPLSSATTHSLTANAQQTARDLRKLLQSHFSQ